MKSEKVWEKKQVRHKQSLKTEQNPDITLWGFVYFTSVKLWLKPVSNCIHRSFRARKNALEKQFWLQVLGVSRGVHIVLTSFVPFMLFANRIQAFHFYCFLLFHINLELMKGAGFSVLDTAFSLYRQARQQLSKMPPPALPGLLVPRTELIASHSSLSH